MCVYVPYSFVEVVICIEVHSQFEGLLTEILKSIAHNHHNNPSWCISLAVCYRWINLVGGSGGLVTKSYLILATHGLCSLPGSSVWGILQVRRLEWLPFPCPKLTFSSVQSLSRVQLFATPWIAACQASLSITNSWSSLWLTSTSDMILKIAQHHTGKRWGYQA